MMRDTPPLFTYGTGVSLRTPERRASRLSLLLALLLMAALVAAVALAAYLWLTTADYAVLLPNLRRLVGSLFSTT